MKRDMDLVRDILLQVDASTERLDMGALLSEGADDEGDEGQVLAYHLQMLIQQAGLLKGVDAGVLEGPYWIDLQLTWAGHEYLDQVRDPEIWKQAKAGAKKAGGMSLDIIGAVAKGLIKVQVAKHTGIEI